MYYKDIQIRRRKKYVPNLITQKKSFFLSIFVNETDPYLLSYNGLH